MTEERHKIRREKVRSRRPVYYEVLQKNRSGDNELTKTKVSSNFPNFDAILKSPIATNFFFLILEDIEVCRYSKF